MQNQEAPLEKLCSLFNVEMLAEKAFHDGKSPIHVTDFLSYKNNFEELWQLLVPERGRAKTAQGETIRIAGEIRRELMYNGGINGDDDYCDMLFTFREYLRCGTPLEDSDTWIDEIIEMKFVDASDAQDFQLEYSDEKATANSDNCNGDKFHYTSLERMQKAIAFLQRKILRGFYPYRTLSLQLR